MANVSTWYNVSDELYNGTTIITNVNDGNGSVNETTVRVDLLSTEGVQKDALFLPWNNPDNFISFETYKLINTIVHCGLDPIPMFTGLPTNLLTCLVFYKQGLRDRMNLCLFVLALVDTLHILSITAGSFSSFIELWDPAFAEKYNAYVLAQFVFFLLSMRTLSGCITMVVAVERCVCVVFPLRANSIMRTRTMGALLAAITIVIILAFAVCFRGEVITVPDETTGKVRYVMAPHSYFEDKLFLVFYEIVYDVILTFVLPLVTFVVVGVATAITVIKLRTAMAWRASTSSGRADNHSQQQQAALTKMLVILSCVFMVCSAPLTALSIVRFVDLEFSPFGRYYNLFYASHAVGYFPLNVNSSVNFFVYYFRSTRFRQDVKSLFRCSCKKDPSKSTRESSIISVK